MQTLDQLYVELSRLQSLPTNSSTQAIARIQQQIAIQLAAANAPIRAVEEINNTLGTTTTPPAITDVGNFNMVALQKRQLEKQSQLNGMDFASSTFQATGNTTLASIYGAVVVGNQMAASIYGYIQRPSPSVVVSQISNASLATLITSTNSYLGSSPNQFYSNQMVVDAIAMSYIMVITEFNPPV